MPVTSTGPVERTAFCRSGPSTSPIQRSRVSTSGPYAPYRSTLPRPSLSEQWVRRPVAASSSTNIHIEGVTMPAIGPTVARWWQGSRAMPVPFSKRATASSGSSTIPSRAAPAISPPRSGPEARSQVIGGPACRNSPRWSPSASAAGTTSTSVAWTASIWVRARSFAACRSGSAATVARSASVPVIGGRQSTRVTSTAWAATASANRSAPVPTTWAGVVMPGLRAARSRAGWRVRWRGGPRRRPRRAAAPGG